MNTIYTDARFKIYYDTQDPENEGWAYSFIGWTECGQHRTASGAIDDLRDLRDALASYGKHDDRFDTDTIPTFGGEEPEDTCETWSWSETHLLVGPCWSELGIVPRHEDEDED